jgi:hypothetical protein
MYLLVIYTYYKYMGKPRDGCNVRVTLDLPLTNDSTTQNKYGLITKIFFHLFPA